MPPDAEELNAKGLESNKRGETRGALGFFLEAHQMCPEDARFVLSAANMHLKLGEAEAARSLYAKLKTLSMTPRQMEIARTKQGWAAASMTPPSPPPPPVVSNAAANPAAVSSNAAAASNANITAVSNAAAVSTVSATVAPNTGSSAAAISNTRGAWAKTSAGFSLYSAACRGDDAAIQTRLSCGTDINWRHPDGGSSALYVACECGHAVAARLLLSCGAAPDQARDDGATALYQVCIDGNTELAAMLLAAGAQVDQVNPQGMTPLWVACHREQPALIRASAC